MAQHCNMTPNYWKNLAHVYVPLVKACSSPVACSRPHDNTKERRNDSSVFHQHEIRFCFIFKLVYYDLQSQNGHHTRICWTSKNIIFIKDEHLEHAQRSWHVSLSPKGRPLAKFPHDWLKISGAPRYLTNDGVDHSALNFKCLGRLAILALFRSWRASPRSSHETRVGASSLTRLSKQHCRLLYHELAINNYTFPYGTLIAPKSHVDIIVWHQRKCMDYEGTLQ